MSKDPPPLDPMAMFRDMVGQWEKFANDYGSQVLQRPEAARAMQGATAAGMKAQGLVQESMARVLAGANIPSKADIEALSARLAAVEASLARIEAAVVPQPAVPARPKPSRTRKPFEGA